jgi:DNA repair protein RecO (recombination protein O)
VSVEALGVVLRTTPLRESDLLVVLYTDSLGRVSAVARGARRSKVRFAGALSILVLGKFQLGRPPRGDLWSLEGADVVRDWTHLSSEVFAVAHASYVAELVGAMLPLETPEPHALELIVGLWDSLAEHGPSPAALRTVELALLDLAGHRPALEQCAACGEADLESGCVFDPLRGGAICRRCAGTSRGPGIRPLDPATRSYLRAVLEFESPSAAHALDGDPRFAPVDRIAARDALIAMITSLVGKPLRSLEYLAKLGAAGRRSQTEDS